MTKMTIYLIILIHILQVQSKKEQKHRKKKVDLDLTQIPKPFDDDDETEFSPHIFGFSQGIENFFQNTFNSLEGIFNKGMHFDGGPILPFVHDMQENIKKKNLQNLEDIKNNILRDKDKNFVEGRGGFLKGVGPKIVSRTTKDIYDDKGVIQQTIMSEKFATDQNEDVSETNEIEKIEKFKKPKLQRQNAKEWDENMNEINNLEQVKQKSENIEPSKQNIQQIQEGYFSYFIIFFLSLYCSMFCIFMNRIKIIANMKRL